MIRLSALCRGRYCLSIDTQYQLHVSSKSSQMGEAIKRKREAKEIRYQEFILPLKLVSVSTTTSKICFK